MLPIIHIQTIDRQFKRYKSSSIPSSHVQLLTTAIASTKMFSFLIVILLFFTSFRVAFTRRISFATVGEYFSGEMGFLVIFLDSGLWRAEPLRKKVQLQKKLEEASMANQAQVQSGKDHKRGCCLAWFQNKCTTHKRDMFIKMSITSEEVHHLLSLSLCNTAE